MSTETEKPAKDPNVIVLKGVRAAFLHVFKPFQDKNEPEKEGKYSLLAILDKKTDAAQIANLQAHISRLAKSDLKLSSIHESKCCLKDGSVKADKEGFSDQVMFVSASESRKPKVLDQKKNPVDKDDPRIFSGAYFNVVIRLWAMDNKYGKKINASLVAVQYVRSGEPLGSGGVDPDAYLDEEAEEEDGDIM